MARRSGREGKLYQYRPEDIEAQREAALRMKAQRDRELRAISEDFDGTIRGKLEEEGVSSQPSYQPPVESRRRRKRSFMDGVVSVLSSVARVWGRRGGGSHRLH
jgi:hypothetical protein